MCGCGKGSSIAPEPVQRAAVQSNGECPYSSEQLATWLNLITCYRDRGLYVGSNIKKQQLQAYIGTILSAQNYLNNICYFEKELQEISNFVIVVIATGLC